MIPEDIKVSASRLHDGRAYITCAVDGQSHDLVFTFGASEDDDPALKTQMEVAEALASAMARARHWKANHDNQVAKARILHDRTDIPLERTRAYAYVTQLECANAQLHAAIEAMRSEFDTNTLPLLREVADRLGGAK